MNLKMLSRKSEILTAGVWYVEGSTLWANLHIILALLYILWDHVITSHLFLCSNQLAGRYMICKNTKNMNHHGYWLRGYHVVCHFALSLNEHFVMFASWLLLAVSQVWTPTLNEIIIIKIIIITIIIITINIIFTTRQYVRLADWELDLSVKFETGDGNKIHLGRWSVILPVNNFFVYYLETITILRKNDLKTIIHPTTLW